MSAEEVIHIAAQEWRGKPALRHAFRDKESRWLAFVKTGIRGQHKLRASDLADAPVTAAALAQLRPRAA